jgi:hypothetical protein
MATSPPQDQDIAMASVSPAPAPSADNPDAEPKYGGFTRFEIELEVYFLSSYHPAGYIYS